MKRILVRFCLVISCCLIVCCGGVLLEAAFDKNSESQRLKCQSEQETVEEDAAQYQAEVDV